MHMAGFSRVVQGAGIESQVFKSFEKWMDEESLPDTDDPNSHIISLKASIVLELNEEGDGSWSDRQCIPSSDSKLVDEINNIFLRNTTSE